MADQSTVAGGISLGMSLFILISTAWIWTYPDARHYLDRISFRLLLWAVAFEVIYDTDSIIFYSNVGSSQPMIALALLWEVTSGLWADGMIGHYLNNRIRCVH